MLWRDYIWQKVQVLRSRGSNCRTQVPLRWTPADAGLQRIKDWPVPTTMTEVRGFLGITGTIRVFTADYAMISKRSWT
jgi:hypothetical protein